MIPGKQYAIELQADLAEADKSATTWYRLLKGGTRNGITGYSTQCELLVNATGMQECVTFDFNFMYQLSDTKGSALNVYRHDSFLERVGVVKFRLTQYGSSPSTADFYLDMKINHDVVAVDRTWTVNLKVVQGGSVIEAPTTFLEKITNYTGIDAHIEYDIGLAAFAVVPSSNAAPFTIMSTGNVGIGTTNPVGVNGGQRLEGSSSTGFEYIATRDDTAAVADDFVGAYLFKNTDTDGVEPHYAGMSSKMTGGNGPMDLRFHTNRDQYESDTPQMIINSAGYVGIGTNAPAYTLDVNGTTQFRAGQIIRSVLANNVNRPAITDTLQPHEIRASATGNGGDAALASGSGFLRIGAGGAVGAGDYISYIDLTGYSSVADMNRNIVFGTSETERMRIIDNGSVGIGTNAPANSILDVDGTLRVGSGTSALINLGRSGTVASYRTGLIHHNGTDLQINNQEDGDLKLATNNGNKLIIDSSGNVDITGVIRHIGDENNLFGFSGTDTFKIATGGTDRLTINSAGTATFGNSLVIPDYIYHDGDGSDAYFGFPANDTIVMRTSGVDRLTVKSDGNVGIGTTAPGGPLTIYGNSSNYFEFNPAVSDDTSVYDRTSFGATSYKKQMNMKLNNRNWYWGIVNDNSSYLGLACDGGGGDDPDTVAIFTYTGDLYVNNLVAKTNGIFDGKVGIGTDAPLSLFNSYGGSLWNGSDHESVVCATLSVVRGTGNGVEKADAGTGAILKFTHGGTDYRHVTMESVSEANLSAEVGIRFKTVEASSGPVERMRISAHGNVGIGTDNPGTKLEIQATTPVIRLTDDRLSTATSGLELGAIEWYSRESSLPNDYSPVAKIAVHMANSTTAPDGEIRFSTGINGVLTERMVLDINGNVGIGTVTPRGKLDIYTGATTTAGLILDRYATGTYRTELYQGANGLDIKVGHGSVEPTSVVDVERFSATSARLRIASPGCLRNDGGIEVASYTDITDCKQIWDTGSRFRIFTNGDSKLLFSSAGGSGTLAATTALSFNGADHVGINTATPDTNYALTVEGTIKCGSLTSTGGGIYLHLMYFTGFGEGANKVNLFRSTEDDDVVYYRFRNQQSIHQTEIGGYIQGYLQEYSDDRLKVNERYLTDGLDVIKRLKPQVYDKRPDLVENLERDGHNVESIERKEVGFIAQDLYYEVPELKHIVDVGGGVIPAEHITIGDDPTVDPDYSSWGNVAAGVRYTEIIPYNTAAIQDLSNLRDLDVDRITVLESQVSNLLVRVQTLESGTP